MMREPPSPPKTVRVQVRLHGRPNGTWRLGFIRLYLPTGRVIRLPRWRKYQSRDAAVSEAKAWTRRRMLEEADLSGVRHVHWLIEG